MRRESLPSGNGRIGAAVYGAVKDETITISHEDLWHWGRKDAVPDVSYTLVETRRLMDEGQYLEASWNLTNTLKDQGYDTSLASSFPLSDLCLSMPCSQAFSGYSRVLDMETGEVTVRWRDGETAFERSLFVSRADDMIVYRIKSGSGTFVQGEIRFALHAANGDLKASDRFMELEKSVQVMAESEFVHYAVKNEDGNDKGSVAVLFISFYGL
jgi:alpha-L-fucosidase 2